MPSVQHPKLTDQSGLHGQRQHHPRRGTAAQDGTSANQETALRAHARSRRGGRPPRHPRHRSRGRESGSRSRRRRITELPGAPAREHEKRETEERRNKGIRERGNGRNRNTEEPKHRGTWNTGRAKPPIICKSPPKVGGLLHFPAGDFPCRAQNPIHGLRDSFQLLRIRTSIPGVASCAIVSTRSSHTS